jgi:hypothetical protein
MQLALLDDLYCKKKMLQNIFDTYIGEIKVGYPYYAATRLPPLSFSDI